MTNIFNDDFILMGQTARDLYHNYSKDEPIIDYHCHLQPKEMLNNVNYRNITHIWLGGDHYKWRLMRANGFSEEYVTGDADDKEKFKAFAATLENAAGNPIYEWSHLELRRFFGIDKELNSQTAEEIWEETNRLLATEDFKPRNLIANKNVKVVCTTDDPIDNLEDHQSLKTIETRFKVLPSFRPDKAFNITGCGQYLKYIKTLSQVSRIEINSYESLLEALENRLIFFKENGCLVTDHGFINIPNSPNGYSQEEVNAIFTKVLNSANVTQKDFDIFMFHAFVDLMGMYKKHDIIMQMHFGCIRSLNSQMFAKLGPDTGFDAIADTPNVGVGIAKLLDCAKNKSGIPTMVWYSLNPNDWMSIVTVMGGFQDGIGYQSQHFGSGWWFDDTYSGMKNQMTKLAEGGLLGNFVGMLTDSRSFLSWPRHEYFRRILCDLLGELVDQGRLSVEAARRTAKNVSYENVRKLLKQ